MGAKHELAEQVYGPAISGPGVPPGSGSMVGMNGGSGTLGNGGGDGGGGEGLGGEGDGSSGDGGGAEGGQ